MEYEKATLKIEMEDCLLVKPSKNIAQTVHVYQSSSAIHDYDSGFNPCHVFKEAISPALFYYYPLAGILVFFFKNNR